MTLREEIEKAAHENTLSLVAYGLKNIIDFTVAQVEKHMALGCTCDDPGED